MQVVALADRPDLLDVAQARDVDPDVRDAANPLLDLGHVLALVLDQPVRVVGEEVQMGRARVRSRRQAAWRLAGGGPMLLSAASMQQHGRSIRHRRLPRCAANNTKPPLQATCSAGARPRGQIDSTTACPTFASHNRGGTPMEVVVLPPLVALIAGILILIVPRLLNYIVAIYLILIGLLGLFGHYSA